jgi:hypothetical protein
MQFDFRSEIRQNSAIQHYCMGDNQAPAQDGRTALAAYQTAWSGAAFCCGTKSPPALINQLFEVPK